MNTKTLHWVAVTRDTTIRQSIHSLEALGPWSVVLFDETAHIFSAPLTDPRLLLLDEAATGGNYLPAIRRLRKRFPVVDVVVIGGPKSDDVLRRERSVGVDYYIDRPVDPKSLGATLHHRLKISHLKWTAGIVGRSPHIEEILEAILQVGPTEVPILIEGESGTGKDVVARATHTASRRCEGPYVAINCGSLAEGVLESELFGHEKGAFTGAVSQRMGVFERANRGTIFLDEVGEMSHNMQVRLLRVLETGEVLRVGGVKSVQVDVRVIAATNRNLSAAVREGRFRQDLYYRLKGVNFYLPPLRERREDIPILVDNFVHEANAKHGKKVKGIESEGLNTLVRYSWPGNIRELKNLVDTLVVLTAENRIAASLVENQLETPRREAEQTRSGAPGGDVESLLPIPMGRPGEPLEREVIYASILALHRDVREILALLKGEPFAPRWGGMKEVYAQSPDEGMEVRPLSQMERSAISRALRISGGNRRKASAMLGISERTLYRKIKEYGLL